MKLCRKCDTEKSEDCFHQRNRRGRTEKHPTCKNCVNTYNRERYWNTPGERDKHLAKLQNLTDEEKRKSQESGKRWYNTPRGRAKTIMKDLVKRNKKHNITLDFDEEYVENIIKSGYCQLTGTPFVLAAGGDSKKRVFSPSIDRIDNSKGYTRDNVRIVVWQVNLMKGELTDDELSDFCHLIIRSMGEN